MTLSMWSLFLFLFLITVSVWNLVDLTQWRKCRIVNRWRSLSAQRLSWSRLIRGNVKYLFSRHHCWTVDRCWTNIGKKFVNTYSPDICRINTELTIWILIIFFIEEEKILSSYCPVRVRYTSLSNPVNPSCWFLLLFPRKKIWSLLAVLW